jgi:hypothetical protein
MASAQRIAALVDSNNAKKPSPGRVDFATVEPLKRSADDVAIAGQQRVPALVAQAYYMLCRTDDVGEQSCTVRTTWARFAVRPALRLNERGPA